MKTLETALKNVKPAVVVQGTLSPERIKEINTFNREAEDAEKIEIFEYHAEKYGKVRDVLNGDTSFYEVGSPIIEQSKKIEERFGGKRFGYVSKWDILGRDDRSRNDVAETTHFLREQRIIDPQGYFSSHMLVPDWISVSARKIDDYSLTVFGGSTIMGALIGPMLDGNSAQGFLKGLFGGILLGAQPILISQLHFGRSNYSLAHQRTSFENALNNMDAEVKRLYGTTSRLSGETAA